MLARITPDRAIQFSWLSILLTCCWPLPPNASKKQDVYFKILRVGSFCSSMLLFLPLLYGMYLHYGDTAIFVKSLSLLIATIQSMIQMLLCAAHYDRLQRLVTEMKVFCKEAKQHERDVLQEYVDNCSGFYGFFIIWLYICAVAVILGTCVLSQSFPFETEYPFSTDSMLLKCIIFFHQSFAAFQCAAHVCVNCFGALLLWFAAAKFKILMVELQSVSDIPMLITCMKKHESVRRYAVEVTLIVRFITLITIMVGACGLVTCCFAFLNKQPLLVTIQFISLTTARFFEAFVCAWPADHLMNISTEFARGAYETAWYLQPLDLQRQILCVLMPCKPVMVSIGCIIPILSLNYYCSYLSTAFSVLNAFRVLFLDEDRN